ncbi:hypothetical protein P9112_011905 [Eukaryota sp. TZLM1-RC]
MQIHAHFVKKAISEVNQGRPLLFCRSCKAQDTLRPPVKISVEVSPASSIPLSIELRSFTSKLKKNEWDVSRKKQMKSLKMIAYMDDVVLIGDLNIVKKATVCFKELFTKIGLRLNLLKCVLLSNSPVSTIIDDIEIQAKLYSIDAIRHLGSFLGNNDEITKNCLKS